MTTTKLHLFDADSHDPLHSVSDLRLATGNLTFIALWAAQYRERFDRNVVLIAPTLNDAERFRDDVELAAPDDFGFFPPDELLPFDDREINPAIQSLRLEALDAAHRSQSTILVTDARSLCRKLPEATVFQQRKVQFQVNEEVPFEITIETLAEYGYQRVDLVERVGTFSVRGGIVDVFPWTSTDPVRIEFWGDTIESIRSFDLVSQRSIEKLEQVELLPNLMVINGDATLIDHLNNPVIVWVYPDQIRAQISDCLREVREIAEHKQIDDQRVQAGYFEETELVKRLTSTPAVRVDLQAATGEAIIKPDLLPVPNFNGDFSNFANQLAVYQSEGMDVIIRCENPSQKERLIELFDEFELPECEIRVGEFHTGFIFESRLAMINEHEIFNRFKRVKPYKKFKRAEALRSLNALSFNDYVVHVDYGIGQFKGLRKVDLNNGEKECLLLEYENADKVYVSIDKIHKVQKYSAEDGAEPKRTKIGGKEWDRLKLKTRKQVEKIAAELVQLYAERALAKGFAFSTDTKWQHELEASFAYTDTPDQMAATESVKLDMEKSVPMDRLICGDVGFGKTEIAVRAAFKAVQDSKQVAVLVPTTILAQQHFETFRERLASFPTRVELLSRFRTGKQQSEVLAKLKSGEVDIIIGTHRLLSEDVGFKDLGLIVVDEEQRFGVKNKEKLKHFRKGADVLTLTATPIPRTLQQSLVGVREVSNIETPPVNRLPIISETIPWDEEQIYSAIMRELDRGGQVYFVHNRVQTIDQVKEMVQRIVPKARIAIGHGQMNERELAAVMTDFKAGEYDILLATMIIENGLDIPNVNTILVNHAERFGLAQLYQLRGRVGRSQRQAYAYFITPSMNRMTDVAVKRLWALEEFSELGSGMKISMRDLEIRGAGNLLGHQQSGNIANVGYELYLEILEEAIAELKQEIDDNATEIVRKRKIDTQFDIDQDALIPSEYVPNANERMNLYHRLVQCENDATVDELAAELTDRFGQPPDPVNVLLAMVRLRNRINAVGGEKVDIRQNRMRITFSEQISGDTERVQLLIQRLMSKPEWQVRFDDQKGFSVRIMMPPKPGVPRTNQAVEIATEIAAN